MKRRNGRAGRGAGAGGGAKASRFHRIAIFGSARIRKGDAAYKEVFRIAQGLAEAGFDIVTGGGPGLMQAANAGQKSAWSGTKSIGLTIRLPQEQKANSYLDIKKEFSAFSARLDEFMALSDAVVVATGGIGTLLELFYTWQLIQVGHVPMKPIVLYGKMWTGLLSWMRSEVLARGLVDGGDLKYIVHLNSVDEVVAFLRKSATRRANQGQSLFPVRGPL